MAATLWPQQVDYLGLEQSDDTFSQGIGIEVADAAHGGIDIGLGKVLGVLH